MFWVDPICDRAKSEVIDPFGTDPEKKFSFLEVFSLPDRTVIQAKRPAGPANPSPVGPGRRLLSSLIVGVMGGSSPSAKLIHLRKISKVITGGAAITFYRQFFAIRKRKTRKKMSWHCERR